LEVQRLKTDEIGRLAFSAKVPILELTQRTASLEEAFLEITADAEEYKAQSEGKKRGKS